MRKPRLMVFDILRILSIGLIIAGHIRNTGAYDLPYLFQSYDILGIGSWKLGTFAVSAIIFVSGAVLEYNYGEVVKAVSSGKEYGKFILKRVARLYPIYLLTLPVAWISCSYVQYNFWSSPILVITAMRDNLGQYDQFLNDMAWFVGLMVILYVMYPILSDLIEKYGICAIGTIFIISHAFVTVLPYSGYYSPLCRMFEFALGIWCVKMLWYPKWENTNSTIRAISDFTYPAVITHTIFFNWFYPYGLPQYLIIATVFSLWFWYVDKKIQTIIKPYLN